MSIKKRRTDRHKHVECTPHPSKGRCGSDGKICFGQRLADFLGVIQHVLEYAQHFPTASDQQRLGGRTAQELFLQKASHVSGLSLRHVI